MDAFYLPMLAIMAAFLSLFAPGTTNPGQNRTPG
jgi:hypothetical protein